MDSDLLFSSTDCSFYFCPSQSIKRWNIYFQFAHYTKLSAFVWFFLTNLFFFPPQMSRVKVHSTTPTWSATNDLRTTRIRDTSRGEILLFKEIEWQTTRIEASADESLAKEALTPLRLIANQAKIRIVMKKRLSGKFESCSFSPRCSHLEYWADFVFVVVLLFFVVFVVAALKSWVMSRKQTLWNLWWETPLLILLHIPM